MIRRIRPSDPCVVLNPTGRAIPSVAGPVDIVIKNPTSAVMEMDVIVFDTGGNTGYSAVGSPPPDVADDMVQRLSVPLGDSVPLERVSSTRAWQGVF
ncbi:hypothetical protein [Haloferula sp. A504]|uniref:hypothetical protein n=1 Tax=Haloferula sp. A504 TaxID=3373601 RepID=UPI0031BC5EDE|nr:hypothetical protein [Verrucomicrobiaceae bacterium E54]